MPAAVSTLLVSLPAPTAAFIETLIRVSMPTITIPSRLMATITSMRVMPGLKPK